MLAKAIATGFNCFAAGERYLTEDGVKTFAETAGTVQSVLTRDGKWARAEIRSFGRQPLVEIELRPGIGTRSSVRRVVRATTGSSLADDGARHRHRSSCRRLRSVPGAAGHTTDRRGIRSRVRLRRRHADSRGRARIRLCGEKDHRHLPVFQQLAAHSSRTRRRYGGDPLVVFNGGAMSDWKELPNGDESPEWLASWVEGYLAADGWSDGSGRRCPRDSGRRGHRLRRARCGPRRVHGRGEERESRIAGDELRGSLGAAYSVEATARRRLAGARREDGCRSNRRSIAPSSRRRERSRSRTASSRATARSSASPAPGLLRPSSGSTRSSFAGSRARRRRWPRSGAASASSSSTRSTPSGCAARRWEPEPIPADEPRGLPLLRPERRAQPVRRHDPRDARLAREALRAPRARAALAVPALGAEGRRDHEPGVSRRDDGRHGTARAEPVADHDGRRRQPAVHAPRADEQDEPDPRRAVHRAGEGARTVAPPAEAEAAP